MAAAKAASARPRRRLTWINLINRKKIKKSLERAGLFSWFGGTWCYSVSVLAYQVEDFRATPAANCCYRIQFASVAKIARVYGAAYKLFNYLFISQKEFRYATIAILVFSSVLRNRTGTSRYSYR